MLGLASSKRWGYYIAEFLPRALLWIRSGLNCTSICLFTTENDDMPSWNDLGIVLNYFKVRRKLECLKGMNPNPNTCVPWPKVSMRKITSIFKVNNAEDVRNARHEALFIPLTEGPKLKSSFHTMNNHGQVPPPPPSSSSTIYPSRIHF